MGSPAGERGCERPTARHGEAETWSREDPCRTDDTLSSDTPLDQPFDISHSIFLSGQFLFLFSYFILFFITTSALLHPHPYFHCPPPPPVTSSAFSAVKGLFLCLPLSFLLCSFAS